jgi:hypothetical protein
MGYIIALVLIAIVVPLIFILLSRRTSGGSGIESANHGVTTSEPSAEDITPRAGPVVNPSPPSERKLPPA